MPTRNKPTSIRLHEQTSRMLQELATATGLTRSALISASIELLHSRYVNGDLWVGQLPLWKGWRLTTTHAQHDGSPALVGPDGKAYLPNDIQST